MHDPRVQGAGRTFRDQVDDLDTELSPHRFSCVMEGHFPDPEPLLDPARCRCRPPPCPPRHPQPRGGGCDALRQRQLRGVTLHHEQHLQSLRQNSQPSQQIDRSFLSLGNTPFRLKLSRGCFMIGHMVKYMADQAHLHLGG